MGISPYDFMEFEQKCMRGMGNTHAVNTLSVKRKTKDLDEDVSIRSLIDWFDCTFNQDYYNVDFVLTLLYKYLDLPYYSSLEDKEKENETYWQFNIKQEKGYGKSISYGDIGIFYDDYGNVDKGIKLSISGNGCREFELLLRRGYTWKDFLQEVKNCQTNITRIDLAIDDFKGYFSVGHLKTIALNGYMRSKFRVFEPKGKHLTKDGSSLGHSLYLGSPKSRLFIRFYDKAKEQKHYDGVWNRTELQLRNERAEITVETIVDSENHIGAYAMGILKNYVTFCDKDKIWSYNKKKDTWKKDSNKARWKAYDWWNDFLQGVEKIQLSTELPKNNIERKRHWINDKVSKSLAMLGIAYQEDELSLDWLKNVMLHGASKLEDKDYKVIEKYKEDKKRAHEKNHGQVDIIDMKI